MKVRSEVYTYRVLIIAAEGDDLGLAVDDGDVIVDNILLVAADVTLYAVQYFIP